MIARLMTNITSNSDFLEEARLAGFIYPSLSFQCYCRNYGEDGALESEGWLIFESENLDRGRKVGNWKYYTAAACHHTD